MRIETLNSGGGDEDNDSLNLQGGGGDDASGSGGGGAGDLNEALSATGDAEFYVAEERKPATRSWMVLAALLAAGGAGLYLMHLRTGPKPAAAATSAESQQAKKVINSFLEGGDSSIKLMEKMLNDTQKVVQRFISYPNSRQVPLGDLATNPFRVAAPEEAPDVAELAARKRKEEERQAVLKAVQTLQLQSVMSGAASRSCMINNVLYREGQVVEGFTVEKISPNSVILKQNAYRFELRMQR